MNNNDSGFARAARRLDLFAIGSGYLAVWLILPMVLSLTYEVLARYVSQRADAVGVRHDFHVVRQLLQLGAAYTLHRKGHVRTDSLYTD